MQSQSFLLYNAVNSAFEGDAHGVTIGRDDSGNASVSFPYNPDYVAKVKSIPGHRWHPEDKHWSFPKADGTLEKILEVFQGEEIHIHRKLVEPIDPALQSELSNHPSLSPLAKGRIKEGRGLKDLRTSVENSFQENTVTNPLRVISITTEIS